jgi:hypothetical protein
MIECGITSQLSTTQATKGIAAMSRAIETSYNGYRFRSRLEARWAVFFHALGVKYKYESEGFDLGGVYYLPDFWLPHTVEELAKTG